MNDKVIRTSLVAPYIDGLLEEKHANGYSYKSEELVLNRFDQYCLDQKLDTLEITREFLSGWMERADTEGAFNQ
jgi:integrase/recombinase XerD